MALRLDGTSVAVEVTSVPIIYRDLKGAVVFSRDIFERKLQEINLRQQQKLEAIGILAGGVAHEINNPINGIMNYADLILDDVKVSTQGYEYAKEIIAESKRISKIVRNLLQFSRFEKQTFEFADINEIIQNSLTLIKTLIKKDNINLIVKIEENVPFIKCRSQQIQQVIINLLTNARDALNEKYPDYHEDKLLLLNCSLCDNGTGKHIRITIEDHGCGIPIEIKESVLSAVRIKNLQDEKILLENKNREYQRNLESMVEKRTVSLQKAMSSIFTLLSTMVVVRDPYTAGHQRRVGNLSAAIGKELRLNNESIEFLRIIGYIHDIGKIVVPSELLTKPGKISSLEFEIIKNHVKIGFEMLLKVDLPDFIGESIYQHHELCDASGYPRGLKGDDIRFEAKIIAVADVAEAMMSHRPYRPALGLEAALNELQSKAGVCFDKDVVQACLNLFKSERYEIDDQSYAVNFPLNHT